MTRSVKDCALMLGAMASYDPKDSTSVDLPVPDYTKALTGDVRGLRVGIPKEYRLDGMSPEIEKLWHEGAEWLKKAGAEIKEVSLPHTKYALPTYYIIAPAEASSNLARYDGVRFGLRVPGESLDDMYEKTRADGFGKEVRRRIMIGTMCCRPATRRVLSESAAPAHLIARDFDRAFKNVDVILTPSTPSAAFAEGEGTDDPIQMSQRCVHRDGEPGRPARHPVPAVRRPGPAARAAADRPRLRRGDFPVGGVIESSANFTAKPAGY
jgi:aspartyl-tRNA(Asn)/glutamyl-tRNA(Gln) amidotransferase subunit A